MQRTLSQKATPPSLLRKTLQQVSRVLPILSLSVALGIGQSAYSADEFPTRPINLVVPFKAGGGTDTYARAVSAGATGVIKTPVVVVNKPGAGGLSGAQSVVTARADGHTMLLTSGGSFLLKTMLSNTGINLFKDFRFVGQVGQLSTALMVPKSSPYSDVKSLISALKAKPGKLRWAHSGRGGFHYVAGKAFLESNGLKAQDVPFKGGSPARAALVGEQTDFAFIGVQQARGFEQLITPLAVVANQRDSVMKDVATFKELDIPFVNINSPVIVMAPKSTPDAVIKSMEQYLVDITKSEKFKSLVDKRGTAAVYNNASEIRAILNQMQQDSLSTVQQITGKKQ